MTKMGKKQPLGMGMTMELTSSKSSATVKARSTSRLTRSERDPEPSEPSKPSDPSKKSKGSGVSGHGQM